MNELVGNVSTLGWVAAKALLLFVTVVAALRLAENRTLADMSAIDFVVAVAVGSIVGRVPNADETSYLQGAVTLVCILLVHSVLTRLRYVPTVARLVDHRTRLLVVHGSVDERQMRRSGLTRDDLDSLLRQHNVHALSDVRYVVFEQRGKFSVVREDAQPPEADGNVRAVCEENR